MRTILQVQFTMVKLAVLLAVCTIKDKDGKLLIKNECESSGGNYTCKEYKGF